MKKQILSTMAFILIIFHVSPFLSAQEGRGNGRLIGVVLDSDQKPIEGAKVTIKYLQYDREMTTTTNKKGSWSFVGLGLGAVTVSAIKEGFVSGGIQLVVSGASRNPRQEIILYKVSESDKKSEENKSEYSKSSFKKAHALFEARKFEEALVLYRDFAEIQPQLYKIGINIANCYLELQRYNEAIEAYKKVLEKMIAENPETKGNPEIAQIYSSIGDVYMRQDNLQEAEKYFKKSIEIDQRDHALPYNVAEMLFAAGKTDEAIKYYEMAIHIKPEWPKSYLQIAYAYLNKGDVKKAIERFNKFLELAPDSPEAPGVEEIIKSLQ